MIRGDVAALAAGLTLLAAGSASAVASPTLTAHHRNSYFGGAPLLPGQSATDSLTVPAAGVPITPYWKITDLQQQCAGAPCKPGTPALASVLQLTATDSAGASWTGSLSALQRQVELPGGMMARGQRRTYRLTLSLPASTGDAYEDMAVSAAFTWGGQASASLGVSPPPQGAGVLGEHIGRHPHGGNASSPQGGSVSDQGGSLPFTGLDVLSMFATALGLLGLGSGLIALGRRRRKAPQR